ncbi:MAG: methionyl-tRNA formyltransferase [SAR86 cluster bacterium]|uniref:Methionyl-tRNA formyltransferase n=1 Tax=SAR86 cluster bacterium TaxID=2030880 RepID=A0A972VUA7_9GAMM|nr:methionyl-tRNA formyltransferase [SAR86 cluster bacterium]
MNLLFAGTPDFAADHLNALIASEHRIVGVITQPDKPGKRGKQNVPCAVKRLAEQHQLPVLQPLRLRRGDIEHLNVDLMVVVAYGQILKPEVLDYPRLGCINVHGSLLPRWRGAAPIQRAILAGDTESGVCIIQMDAGLDTGDVLLCAKTDIASTETSQSLAAKLSELGTRALLTTIEQIAAGTNQPQPQPNGATYAHKIEKHEAQIDWSGKASDIDRMVRGFNPEPIAFTELNGLRMKVWAVECTSPETLALASSTQQAQPGEILAISKRGVLVACGTDALWLTAVQLPLGKGSILTGADILNARKALFAPGTKLS